MDQNGFVSQRHGAQRVSRQQWCEHLEAWRRLGCSQAEYCRRNGLMPMAFSMWKRKLAGHGAGEGVAPRFVPVRVVDAQPGLEQSPSAESAPASFEILLRNGRVVRTGARFDPVTLSRLLAAVEQSC